MSMEHTRFLGEWSLDELVEWAGQHNDYYHPGSRDGCSHCQEMINIYGSMPPIHLLEVGDLEHTRRFQRANPRQTKQPIRARLRTAVFERDAYRCVYCGDWHGLAVDHVYPESKGGTLELDNLQTLCRSCNSRKGARA